VSSVSPVEQKFTDDQAEPAPVVGDMGAFLGALANMLRETTARFEQTTSRVSDMVMAHTGRAGPDLVVALQDFDRLQQEFAAFSEVLSQMESKTGGPWPGDIEIGELKHELLKTVTIADLKKRLSAHFEPPERVINPADEDGRLVAEF
jgi:hypothetical protein